jgi:molybdate transport system regulatory protein
VNRLTGKITSIEHNSHMSLVDVAVGDDIFSATLLETPQTADYLEVGREVTLMFKETEVSLAKNLSGLISMRNRFSATVLGIEHGAIMSAVKLDYCGLPLTSIVTTRAVGRLNLTVGDSVEGLVKANEMVLSHDL